MAKIMLVEDDNNLREIYGARLLAEGYEIVSAKDGEEALALAVKEKPDLIISDIMMPKISGFDMLDILRSTPETKETKVIMMTALSQAEDKTRADKLGADRYLVKSQVTLEDVVQVAQQVLDGQTAPAPVAAPAATSNDGISTAIPTPTDSSVDAPTPTPVIDGVSNATIVEPAAAQDAAAPAPTPTPTNDQVLASAVAAVSPAPVVNEQVVAPTPVPNDAAGASIAAVPSVPTAAPAATPDDSKTSVHNKVITPINDLSQQGSNLEALIAQEEAKETKIKAATSAAVPTAQAVINQVSEQEASSEQAVIDKPQTIPPNPTNPN